jgi:hypothetical protein
MGLLYTYQPCCLELVECHIEPVSPITQYSALRGGHLVVRGRLRRAVLLDVSGEKYERPFHLIEPERGGIETWIPLSFDAVEQEFDATSKGTMGITLLEVFGAKLSSRTGLVLRDLGDQRFARLGIFPLCFGPDAYDSGSSEDGSECSEGKGEVLQVSCWDWMQRFDECLQATITIVWDVLRPYILPTSGR